MAIQLSTIRDELDRVLLKPEQAIALDVSGHKDAAVLVPLYLQDDELHAVFTRRREDLRRHPGEISFPGGRYDEGEADLRATALREADEEIGLPPDAVELIGALQPTPTIATGYSVYPFVGLIAARARVDPQRERGGRGSRAVTQRIARGIRSPPAHPPRPADQDGHLRRRRQPHLGGDRADPRRPVRPDRAAATGRLTPRHRGPGRPRRASPRAMRRTKRVQPRAGRTG